MNEAVVPGRILVLSKRQYMGRDLLDDRYGRFRELPLALARQGLSVRGLCLSYRRRAPFDGIDTDRGAAVQWTSLTPSSLLSPGRDGYAGKVKSLAREFRPDVVWAGSDVLHALLGVAVARASRARLVIDLYDNFEGYPLARIPGVNAALRWAVRRADAVSCISPPLAELVRERYGFRGPIKVVENAIPEGTFAPHDRSGSRMAFGLPAHGFLVGVVGALSSTRGIETVLSAFSRLASERDDAHLVLAGARNSSLSLPRHERVHDLGLLPPDRVPTLLSALDVSIIGNRDTLFGRYCFPQKLYESLACRVPVAVARVGYMAELLAAWPQILYTPDNADELLAALRGLARDPVVPSLDIPSWDRLAEKLRHLLL